MTSEVKKRIAMVLALLAVGGLLTFISLGSMEQNLVYFWDAEQLLAKGEEAYGATVRLGGLVQEGSYEWDAETLDLSFHVAMAPEKGSSSAIRVQAKGAPPQMFREGIGVVVEGAYDGKIFNAERVIVKHDNQYQPPAEGRTSPGALQNLGG